MAQEEEERGCIRRQLIGPPFPQSSLPNHPNQLQQDHNPHQPEEGAGGDPPYLSHLVRGGGVLLQEQQEERRKATAAGTSAAASQDGQILEMLPALLLPLLLSSPGHRFLVLGGKLLEGVTATDTAVPYLPLPG